MVLILPLQFVFPVKLLLYKKLITLAQGSTDWPRRPGERRSLPHLQHEERR
jgi:hypothetical protein